MIVDVKNTISVSVLTLVLLLFSSASFAQRSAPDKYAPKDTVFEEIVLTEEGVAAIDTSGYEWYFDFERSVFVLGAPLLGEEGTAPLLELGFEYTGIPIEERAIIKKKVKHFEVGSVTVRDDEYVDGDIKALDMVTVKGWVQGSVFSIRDRVLITETGRVDGDVQAPRVILKDGGKVYGNIIESQVPLNIDELTSGFSHEFLLVMVIITTSFLFAGFIILALMPRQLNNIEQCIINHKGRSFFLGLLTFLIMPALMILLAITIVGAVLIPLVPFIYAWAIILGIIATGRGILNSVLAKFLQRQIGSILIGLAGILLFMIPWLLAGALMGTESGASYGFGVFFLVFSIIIMIFPVFSGIGAAFLTRFGFRIYTSVVQYGPKPKGQPPTPPVVPAPPPIPDAPFSQKEETKPSDSRIPDQQ